MFNTKFNYYDHPEGEDIVGKMVASNKFALATGLAWSTVDVILLSHTKGYLPTLGRFAYNIGPLMGMATAFTLTTYAATNLRGKDDRINYFFGGMAAGGVYGAWQKCHVTGLTAGLILGIAATIKKLSKIEDWEFFPPPLRRSFSGVHNNDFTIMKDPPKNWTNQADDEKQ